MSSGLTYESFCLVTFLPLRLTIEDLALFAFYIGHRLLDMTSQVRQAKSGEGGNDDLR